MSMEPVSFSVLDETRPVNNKFHIRELQEGSDAARPIYRQPRIGSLAEYEHLDKAFWHARENGFSLPEHRLIQDTDYNPWLEVERLDGTQGDSLVDEVTNVTEKFLSSYGSLLESILESPSEPFHTDHKLEQFIYDGDELYVCDVEPRVAYLDDNPKFDSVANRRLSWAADIYVSCVDNLYEDGSVSRSLMDKAVSIATKTVRNSSYFKPYRSFDKLESQYTSLVGRQV